VRTQPEQQAPPVQRLRIHYAKRGRLRFASHRDFSRAFERAVVRARVPMAYSSGFNPHPRISYAGAAPTGAASEAEYLEIALAETVEPGWVQERLAAVLPDGLDVVRVVESPGGALADRLQASRWRIELSAPYDAAAAAVTALLAQESITVERMTKKGMRSFDCRAAVMSLEARPAEDGCVLEIVIRHAEPAVRPDDVLTGLARVAGLDAGRAPRLSRLEQGPWDAASGRIADPLG
jgi:radical SAM-linked protein